jgi:hypothetical protein
LGVAYNSDVKQAIRQGIGIAIGFLIVGAVAGLLFLAYGYIFVRPRAQKQLASDGLGRDVPAVPAPSGASAIPITVEQVQAAFTNDPMTAETWLKGKRVSITAPTLDVFRNENGSWSVSYITSYSVSDETSSERGTSKYFVDFRFGPAKHDLSLGLQAGQTLTCTGQFARLSRGGIDQVVFVGEDAHP